MDNRGNSNQVSLEFYTSSRVYRGCISCPTGLRVLDFLNSRERNTGGEFLEFIGDSDSINGNGNSRPDQPREYIRESAIQFVAISDADLGRGVGSGSEMIAPRI